MRRILAVVLVACHPANPEPSAVTEARVLVAAAGPVLASARPVCAALPPDRGEACTATVDALAAVVATMGPLLDPCPGDPADEERQVCEASRLEEIRARLPELRRLAAVVAGLARGQAPAPSSSGAP